jgi:hypothetical protein
MVKNSMVRRGAGWSFVLLAGLSAIAGCSSSNNQPRANEAKADPALQPLIGTWEIDCGNGFVQFRLVVAADRFGKFDWQTYTAPGSTSTQINRMDLRLASVNGTVEGTVLRADDSTYNGRKMRISAKDPDSIVVGSGGDYAVVDTDYTMYRESAEREVDCGGD